MAEYTSELRTTTMHHECLKCGIVMAPQMVRVQFKRETPGDPWVVIGFEHMNGCPGLMKKAPSLSARPYVSSSWNG